jgi:2-phospho-L-lactate guanylyltransferase (CobY/MobA/RfbA family)
MINKNIVKSKFFIKMTQNKNKLKPLKDLKFETIGEEFLYLYNSINTKELIDENDELPNIEDLREEYNILVNEEDVNSKYSKSSIYWSEVQEKAIVEYIKEKDPEKKDYIFKNTLYKPFKKLIENIIFTYKLFRNDVDVLELQNDCMSFLITKVDKFKPESGTKSFAYFGTIAKHYLMGEKKTIYKMSKASVEIDETLDELNVNLHTNPEAIDNKSQTTKIFNKIILEIEKEIANPKLLPNDKKVGEAIVWVFRNHEILEVYNKNLVYHLLKERTSLQTKEITYSLSRFKSFYKIFKENFLKSDV